MIFVKLQKYRMAEDCQFQQGNRCKEDNGGRLKKNPEVEPRVSLLQTELS